MVRVIGRGIKDLVDFIRKCLDAGGVPIIRGKYGGRAFENKVVVACWGKREEVEGGTILDIPPDVIRKINEKIGDWKWILEEYGGGRYY